MSDEIRFVTDSSTMTKIEGMGQKMGGLNSANVIQRALSLLEMVIEEGEDTFAFFTTPQNQLESVTIPSELTPFGLEDVKKKG